MDEENVQATPKRRGRPPKVRMAEGVVKAEGIVTGRVDDRLRDDLPVRIPASDIPRPVGEMTVKIDGSKIVEMVREQLERAERKIELIKDEPLLTLHLRRVKNELTDTTGKVHIPASGAIPDGTKLVAHFYREE